MEDDKKKDFITKLMNQPYRYLRRSHRTIDRHIEAHLKGKHFRFDQKWKGVGRRALMDHDELNACAKKLTVSAGEKQMKDQVNKMLVGKLRENGDLPGSGFRYCNKTLNNYVANFANLNGIALVDKSIAKTNNRLRAEQSTIEMLNYLLVIAMTHFYVVDSEDVVWRDTLRTIPAEDRMLYDLVAKWHNKPIRVRPAWLTINSDDSTEYYCAGKQIDKSTNTGFVAKSALKNDHRTSLYHHEDSNKMKGSRVKKYLIMNAGGDAAPAVYCFSGLTEREMRDAKG